MGGWWLELVGWLVEVCGWLVGGDVLSVVLTYCSMYCGCTAGRLGGWVSGAVLYWALSRTLCYNELHMTRV